MRLKETVFFKEKGKIYEGLVVGFEEEKVVVVPYEITEIRWGYSVINFKEKRILSKKDLIFTEGDFKDMGLNRKGNSIEGTDYGKNI